MQIARCHLIVNWHIFHKHTDAHFVVNTLFGNTGAASQYLTMHSHAKLKKKITRYARPTLFAGLDVRVRRIRRVNRLTQWKRFSREAVN